MKRHSFNLATRWPAAWADIVFFSAAFGLPSLSATAVAQAAQAADVNACIFAGRLNTEGRWAPLASGLTLLDANGKPLAQQGKAALDNAKAVRINKNALLAQCNGNQALPSGDASQGSKSPAPALSAGSAAIPILATAYAPVSAGGQWVELKLDVPPQRVVMLTR
jgi:hypothetical protein